VTALVWKDLRCARAAIAWWAIVVVAISGAVLFADEIAKVFGPAASTIDVGDGTVLLAWAARIAAAWIALDVFFGDRRFGAETLALSLPVGHARRLLARWFVVTPASLLPVVVVLAWTSASTDTGGGVLAIHLAGDALVVVCLVSATSPFFARRTEAAVASFAVGGALLCAAWCGAAIAAVLSGSDFDAASSLRPTAAAAVMRGALDSGLLAGAVVVGLAGACLHLRALALRSWPIVAVASLTIAMLAGIHATGVGLAVLDAVPSAEGALRP
jgi:hypothetical protein